MIRSTFLTVAAGALLAAGAAQAAGPGEIGPSSGQTQNGRQLTPAGRLTTLGNFPSGGALTPDGRFYWAANSGHGRNSISVVEVATGEVTQTLPLPGAYVGVAFAPDGRSAYVSGSATGDPDPGGPVKGGAGDEIHTFTLDAAGRATETEVIALSPPAGGRARTTDSLIPTQAAYPEGLDVSPDGATLVVALNQADQVALVDTQTRAVRYVGVGLYPFGAEVDRDAKRAFVTNELSGTVSVIDLAAGRVTATVPVGGPPGDATQGGPLGDFNAHPEGMALDPTRELLYVAVANRDLVAVVNTRTLKTERYVSVGRSNALGTSPVDLDVTPDGRTLFVADANEDAIAVVALTDRVVPATAGTGGTAGTPARAATAAKAGTAAVAAGRSRTVYVPRSATSILKYRTARVKAQRTYKARLRRAKTSKSRAAAKRAYLKQLGTLRATLFVGRKVKRCGGPSAADDVRYRNAVRKATEKRDRALRRARGSSAAAKRKRSAARRALARTAAAAQRRLPARKACAPGKAATSGIAGTPGAAATPGSGGADGAGATRNVPAFTLLGRIPTAAYPQDVRVTPDGRTLVWLAAKGLGAGPNPGQPVGSGGGSQSSSPAQGPQGDDYVLNKLIGRAGVLPLPSDAEIAGPLTAAADKQLLPTNAQAPPAGTPVLGVSGGASDKVKHVFYVVKENRTYDQVLGKGAGGSGPQGDGQGSLEAFGDNDPDGIPEAGEGVTPNLHALARRFGVLDHVYANSEVSIDGHVITSGAFATDYNQKSTPGNYSGRGRAFDYGLYNVTLPPNFSAFDQAQRQSVPFRFYGEASAGTFPGNAANVDEQGFRPTGTAVQAQQDPSYPTQSTYGCVSGSVPCFYDSGVPTARVTTPPTTPPVGYSPATSRYQVFERNLTQEIAAGTVPAFNYLTMPNDHTNGTDPGTNTPSALVADNDFGVGQVVDLISHSSIWKDSAIFVIQDDTQAGADHVDAHRMPALVVSPWAKGGLVTTRFDQYSFLRTAMAIVGLKPLSLNDALATPLYDAFVNAPAPTAEQLAPYDAIKPQQAIDARNGAPRTALARSMSRLSTALPYERQDVVPQPISDRIIWTSVYGSSRPVPAPGPNSSPLEVERAEDVMEVYREGGDVAEFLEANPGEEGEEEEEEGG